MTLPSNVRRNTRYSFIRRTYHLFPAMRKLGTNAARPSCKVRDLASTASLPLMVGEWTCGSRHHTVSGSPVRAQARQREPAGAAFRCQACQTAPTQDWRGCSATLASLAHSSASFSQSSRSAGSLALSARSRQSLASRRNIAASASVNLPMRDLRDG
jgi:DNA-binding transcriptional MocR family regulator